MPRPDDHKKGSAEKMYAYIASLPPKERLKPEAYLIIYEEAKKRNHWIYDPDIKRWQSPEEFIEMEKRISGGEPNRLMRLQIRDPLDGIDAADLQLKSIAERKAVLVKRVIEYYKK